MFRFDNQHDLESSPRANPIESISTKLSSIQITSVKSLSIRYQEEALSVPEPSQEAKLEVKSVLTKYPNGTPCHICGELMKNERGVKLHKAKKH